MQDREICALLGGLDLQIEATQGAMVRAGIVKECTDCAVNGEGTCCGVRTGHKYGSVLLLINLLLGRTLSPCASRYTPLSFSDKAGMCPESAARDLCEFRLSKTEGFPSAQLIV